MVTSHAASVNHAKGQTKNTSTPPTRPSVLLATALVNIKDKLDNLIQVRALLDQGSEISICSEDLVNRLNLKRHNSTTPIIGIGAGQSQNSRGCVFLTMHSRYNNYNCSVYSYILPKLTGLLPSLDIQIQDDYKLKNINLADPLYYQQARVDVLLGADVYGSLLLSGVVQQIGDSNHLTAQQTQLGWILSGQTEVNKCSPTHQPTRHCFTMSSDNELLQLVKSFWMQEEAFHDSSADLTQDDQRCLDHFNQTHTRNHEGRYIVKLPFKSNEFFNYSKSKQHAEIMLKRQEARFAKDPQFYQLYNSFLNEYKNLGHMMTSKTDVDIRTICYLPHHGVKKESSSTTKLRVVFNGSQLINDNKSLNDLLHDGPCLLNKLSDIMTRWRRYKFVFSADVEKMYRQILVHEDDQDKQRILWRPTPKDQMTSYTLKTVTYGLKPAPFLALATLQQLEKDEGKNYPLTNSVISKESYVDDIFSGANTPLECMNKIEQLRALFKAGGFPLKKWLSNNDIILSVVPPEDREQSSTLNIQDVEVFKQLGVQWNRRDDTFTFNSPTTSINIRLNTTKREVLSKVAQLFDPLGWITPVVVTGKIFLQKLWNRGVSWDEQLDNELQLEWQTYCKHLQDINCLKIPRWLHTAPDNLSVEIHGFSDASNVALGAAVYLRVKQHNNTVLSTLVLAKSKVAPMQHQNNSKNRKIRVTTPRLELSAAVLLVQSIKQVQLSLQLTTVPVHLWTDSTIVYYWIQNDPDKFKQFVSNRLKLIKNSFNSETTPLKWHHVAGHDNPADLASRGGQPKQLSTNVLWWHGPQWLCQEQDMWPKLQTTQCHKPIDSEIKPVLAATIIIQHDTDNILEQLLEKYSSLSKMVRVLAWCIKFIHEPKRNSPISQGLMITTDQYENALTHFVKHTQHQYFSNEISLLENNNELPKSSPIIRLTPYIDKEGVLRVGSRLNKANLTQSATHPMILPIKSKLTTLILESIHRSTLHGSPQLMIATARQKYWITGGRIPFQSVYWKCVICTRQRALASQQLMGQLPSTRCNPNPAFINTGVDFAGPFTLKKWLGKCKQTYKAYIAVFVCFATSATHLEVVNGLSTEEFIAAYRRFTSIRGVCKNLYSDCGTNFVGAIKELQSLKTQAQISCELTQQLSLEGTNWHLNPPGAPHQGGKWEAGVKSMKYHLTRIMGATLYTYHQLDTLIKQISAQLNSRPLCPMTNDPNDLEALTPGHFLIGRAMNAIPEGQLLNINDGKLSRWQLIQKHSQQLWNQWSNDYIKQFHVRTKWCTTNNSIQLNSMVILMDERVPPAKWPLARVIQLHPGDDGLVRVVTIKTSTSTFKRPISKLCPLPFSPDE